MADRDAGKPINQAIVQRLQVRNAGPHSLYLPASSWMMQTSSLR